MNGLQIFYLCNMKKMFRTAEIRELDRLTMKYEPIESVALMNRAALTVYDFIIKTFDNRKVLVVAGSGNNGGDGLVVADMLAISNWDVEVWCYTNSKGERSSDCQYYYDKLLRGGRCKVHVDEVLPMVIDDDILVVDALFGTGLSRPLQGDMAYYVRQINQWKTVVVSIDLPSGLGEESTYEKQMSDVVYATHTVSFQFPKLAFFLPETACYVGQWHVRDIGLHAEAIEQMPTNIFYMTQTTAESLLKTRSRFVHKGDMGRALLFVGAYSMMGAAVLASKACVNSGVGVLTTVVPRCGYEIMQISVPESLCICSDEILHATWNERFSIANIKAVGIGPGIGRDHRTKSFVRDVLDSYRDQGMVIDADALYHLKELIADGFILPCKAILTPHEGEFDRLTHEHTTRLQRIQTAKSFATKHDVVVVLKGAYTAIVTPDQRVIYNTTGNAGMATGGSGDVLTGIITALLAQGYDAEQAAMLGVNMHANAGDKAKTIYGEMGVTATRMLDSL